MGIGPATQGMIVLAIFVAIGTGVRLYRTRRDWMRKYEAYSEGGFEYVE